MHPVNAGNFPVPLCSLMIGNLLEIIWHSVTPNTTKSIEIDSDKLHKFETVGEILINSVKLCEFVVQFRRMLIIIGVKNVASDKIGNNSKFEKM